MQDLNVCKNTSPWKRKYGPFGKMLFANGPLNMTAQKDSIHTKWTACNVEFPKRKKIGRVVVVVIGSGTHCGRG
jgi:hypothetical protein